MKNIPLSIALFLSMSISYNTYAAEKLDLKEADFHSKYKTLLTELIQDKDEKRIELYSDVDKAQVKTVGIIGAGITGLHSALLIKKMNQENDTKVKVKIFEAEGLVGGRIYTHRFNDDKDQYFEAGAMRIPNRGDEVRSLIDYVNEQVDTRYKNDQEKWKKYHIKLIDYQLHDEAKNNYVYANGKGPQPLNKINYEDFGFKDEHGGIFKKAPEELLKEAIEGPLIKLNDILSRDLKKPDTQKDFRDFLEEYDDFSMRNYLLFKKKWSHERINYVEVMTSQTHQFNLSFVELLIETLDFSAREWVTIDQGMSRLPQTCAKLIGRNKISLGTKVIRIEQDEEGVSVYHSRSDQPERFDRVILAVPPSVIRMLDRDIWSEKEEAIRSMYFEPLYKIGLRFKTRFWEKTSTPSFGGQSITDLPSRWVVYPSNGLGSNDPGVLLCYSWASDALKWLPYTLKEQTEGAVRDLSKLYPDTNIQEQLMDSHSVSWAQEWSLGDAKFLPGQLKKYLIKARKPENKIFFAGENLSVYHTWIRGAIDSSRITHKQIFGKEPLL